MSIASYHMSHVNNNERWYNGKKNPHENPMSTLGETRVYGKEYELEFPSGSDLTAISNELQAAMGMTADNIGRLKCERDGSLYYGFECISYPATLSCDRKSYGWRKFFEIVNAHNPVVRASNGMHVHVSRASLGHTVQAQELCIAKIVYLLDNFKTMFGKIGGRSYANAHYCHAANAGIETTDKSAVAVYKSKVAYADGDRYKALNLRNAATVEFRIFAVDYNCDHFLARIEFCDWIVELCKSTTMDKLYTMTAADLKSGMRNANPEKYGELNALINELYPVGA